jgi:hypothetical protein
MIVADLSKAGAIDHRSTTCGQDLFAYDQKYRPQYQLREYRRKS